MWLGNRVLEVRRPASHEGHGEGARGHAKVLEVMERVLEVKVTKMKEDEMGVWCLEDE